MAASTASFICSKCRWAQKLYRARANCFCLRHEMTVHDPLATFCADFESAGEESAQPQLRELRLADRQMYVWILMRPPAGPDGVSAYYYEHVHLCDIADYQKWRADRALQTYRTLQREGQARLNQSSEG